MRKILIILLLIPVMLNMFAGREEATTLDVETLTLEVEEQTYDTFDRGYLGKLIVEPLPLKIKGVKQDTFSFRRLEESSFEKGKFEFRGRQLIPYLEIFAVWTTDTAKVLEYIGDKASRFRGYGEKLSEEYEVLSFRTSSPVVGMRLVEELRNLPEVVYVDNHYYSIGWRRVEPLGSISVRVYDPSDSIILYQNADRYHYRNITRYCPTSYEPTRSDSCLFNLEFIPHSKQSLMESALKMHKSGLFEYVEYDTDSPIIHHVTDDPEIKKQWAIYNLDIMYDAANKVYSDLNVSPAWNYATGKDVKICIIDGGVDITHPDLKDNYYKCRDIVEQKDTIIDFDYHATMCAGIACAVRNNKIHISGVAPDAKLMSAKAKVDPAKSNFFRLTSKKASDIAGAITWAYKNNADVISLSWGCEDNTEIENAIKDAIRYGRGGKGCIVVTSAGNSGDAVTFPGTLSDVISVGAINESGERAGYSCYDSNLTVMAPGNNIISLAPGDKVAVDNGTSLACPAVAGVAALILEVFPSATHEQVFEILASTAKIPKCAKAGNSYNGKYGSKNMEYGYGIVDACAAVRKAFYMANPHYSDSSKLEF